MSRSNTIHPAIITFVGLILPVHRREDFYGDLDLQNLTIWTYLLKAVDCSFITHKSQLRPAFKLRLFVMEAAALAVAFSAAPTREGFYSAIAAGLAGLVLRDTHVYPDRNGAIFEGVDALAGVAFIAGFEFFASLFAPNLGLSHHTLNLALPLAFLMVSMVRFFMRPQQEPGDKKAADPFGAASFETTLFISGLWAAAVILVPVVSPAFPGQFVPPQDNLLLLAAMVAAIFSLRLQTDRIGGTGSFTVIFKNATTIATARKLDLVYTPPKTKSKEFPLALALEVSSVVFYGLPVILVLAGWMFGRIPSPDMDWLIVGARTCACLSLSALWLAIRRANQNLARKLQKEIEERKTA